MAGFGKLMLAALAVGLIPYEIKKKEDGSVIYKSLLLRADSRKDETGEKNVIITFSGKPSFIKKPVPQDEEAPVEEAPVEEVPAEEAPAEEALVEEAPVEEAPVEEAPVEEAPAVEPEN